MYTYIWYINMSADPIEFKGSKVVLGLLKMELKMVLSQLI